MGSGVSPFPEPCRHSQRCEPPSRLRIRQSRCGDKCPPQKPILRNLDPCIGIKRSFCQQKWSVDLIVHPYTGGIKRSRPIAHFKKGKHRIQAFINPLPDFAIHFHDPRRKAVYLCKDLSERSRKDINVNRTTNIRSYPKGCSSANSRHPSNLGRPLMS